MGFIKRSTRDTQVTKVSETEDDYQKFSNNAKKNEQVNNKDDDGESTKCCDGKCKK